MLHSENELVALAQTYCSSQKITYYALGVRVVNNHKFFKNLEAGRGAHSGSLRQATEWFQDNWPEGVPWPENVPQSGSISSSEPT